MVVMTTVVAPILSGSFAYLVTRRRDAAEAGKSGAETRSANADTAEKWRLMANDELERRRRAEERIDELDDAFKQAIDENSQLRSENGLLRQQLRAAGLVPMNVRPEVRRNE